jgi:cobalt-zinc-cadmium resistance protein CzcA
MIFCFFTYVPVASSLFLKPTVETQNHFQVGLIRKPNPGIFLLLSLGFMNTKKVMYGAVGYY